MEGSYDPEPTGVRTLPRDEGFTSEPRGMEPRMAEPRSIGGSGMGNVSGMGSTGAVTVQPRPSVVRPFSQPQAAKVHVTVPVGFNDAQEIGDKLKANQPVIVNLQGIDRDLSRRLIDFSSGLTYGLGGAMERVADQVFLLTPSNVEVSAEEKRRRYDPWTGPLAGVFADIDDTTTIVHCHRRAIVVVDDGKGRGGLAADARVSTRRQAEGDRLVHIGGRVVEDGQRQVGARLARRIARARSGAPAALASDHLRLRLRRRISSSVSSISWAIASAGSA